MKLQPLFKDLNYWNRRLHIHVGLFLLFFIWLFSFSGLLLNHGGWKFASFWEQRKEKQTTTPISIPAGLDSINVLKSIKSQLKVSGEVMNVKMAPDSIDFGVSYPGYVTNLHIDF